MAIVRDFKYQTLERAVRHSNVECTYCVVTDKRGDKYLQLDTYGSSTRKILGKKSQSIRFAPDAVKALSSIIAKHFT